MAIINRNIQLYKVRSIKVSNLIVHHETQQFFQNISIKIPVINYYLMKPRFQRKFLKPSEISDRLKCPICLDVFLNPLRISCGHTLCQACLQSYIKSSTKCPQCRVEIDENLLGIDVLATQIINELLVECPMMECPWKGQYQILRLHLDEECVFKDFIPPNCEKLEAPRIVDEEVAEKINQNTTKGTLTSRITAYSALYKKFIKKQSNENHRKKPKVIDLQSPDHGYEFLDPNQIKFKPKRNIKRTRNKTGQQFLTDLFKGK